MNAPPVRAVGPTLPKRGEGQGEGKERREVPSRSSSSLRSAYVSGRRRSPAPFCSLRPLTLSLSPRGERGLFVLALCFITACSAPQVPDAGPLDSGIPPRPQQHCVQSDCDTGGNYQVIFTTTGFPPPLLCRAPPEKQLRFTSNGTTLCMLDASDGGTDGGCGFSFVVRFENDAGLQITDTWDIHQPDAGHLYGTWSTQAVRDDGGCTGAYSIHAVR